MNEECSPAAAPQLLKLIQGSTLSVVIRLINKATGKPYNLTGAGTIKIWLPSKTDPAVAVQIAGSLQSADLGELLFPISSTNAALVNDSDDKQDFEVSFVQSAAPVVVQFKAKLLVSPRLLT